MVSQAPPAVRSPNHLVARIRWVVVLACVAISLLYAWQAYAAWKGIEQSSLREATNLVGSLAEQTGSSLELTDAVLQRMYYWAHKNGVGPSQHALLRDILGVRTPSMSDIGELAFLDAVGNRAAHSGPRLSREAGASEQRAFIWHAAHASLDPLVVPPDPAAGGEPVLTLSRRFNDRQGHFAGVVIATIRVASLRPLYDAVDVGRDGFISLLLDNGSIVFRKPVVPAIKGIRRFNNETISRARRSSLGSLLVRSRIDGKERIVAFSRVHGFPLIVVVGFGAWETFAGWRFFSILGLIGTLGLIVTNVILARGLVAELRRSARDQVRLSHYASRDGLTGLFNRREFDTAIEREWRRSLLNETPVALLMIDVDLFKKYNDRYGHQRGDDALRRVASCLLEHCTRPRDIVARYGGEEFAVVLPSTPAGGANALAENVRRAVAECRIEHLDSPHGRVTVSIGVADMSAAAGHSPADLIRRADVLLYEAKHAGRNRVMVATDTAAMASLA
jgi:diguanylate cyclase (GGDEF)-like protein